VHPKVFAVSPLITELPIALSALFTVSNLMQYHLIIGIISICGACYIVDLGIENLRAQINTAREKLPRTNALGRGVMANFLSSHPYLFWLSIGGPLIYKSLDVHIYATISFILGFYTLLIRVKNGYCFCYRKIPVLGQER